MSLAELQTTLGSNFDLADPKLSVGLSEMTAANRLVEYGNNALSPPKEKPEFIKYLLHYLDPFMLLLNLTGWLSFIAYEVDTEVIVNLWVAIVLWTAVFLSVTFGYVTERRAGDAMKSFKKMLPRSAQVIRGGKRINIPAESLVPGDVVYVGTGAQVPADIRILSSTDMKVEKSSLTGESLPVPVGAQVRPSSKYEDCFNIIFSSSQCIEGECIGVVIETGDKTFIGTIAHMVNTIKPKPTPVQVEIRHFVARLGAFAFVLAIAFFFIGGGRGKPWLNSFIQAFVIVMVACIPEGLPVTVLSCLSVTSRRMAAKNVFIKQLSSVETLGSVSAIASDKTGTLTQNKMKVVNLWIDEFTLSSNTTTASFAVQSPMLTTEMNLSDGSSNSSSSKRSAVKSGPPNNTTYNLLELAAVLCNRAKFSDEKQLNASEAGILNRSQLLTGMEETFNFHRIRDTFPSLFPGLEEPGLSLHAARKTLQAEHHQSPESRTVLGDATDKALFEFVAQRQEIELLRYHHRVVFELPFNSRNKYAITIVKPHEVKVGSGYSSMGSVVAKQEGAKQYSNRRLFMKGAPEVVLAKCSTYLFRGEQKPIDAEFKASFDAAYRNFGNRGERVIGFAWQELPLDQYGEDKDNAYSMEHMNFPSDNLCFIGLIALVDPPKPTVPDAVKLCRQAGIKVLMVTGQTTTCSANALHLNSISPCPSGAHSPVSFCASYPGDHALTAAAIARQVGIITSPTAEQLAELNGCRVKDVPEHQVSAIVIEGSQLNSFQQSDWDRVLTKPEVVFARTTPAQKLQIVQNLQRLNHCVAVTGDGVRSKETLQT